MEPQPKVLDKTPSNSPEIIKAPENIQKLKEAILGRIMKRDNTSDLVELDSFMNDVVKQVAFLEKKYPNARDYLTLHTLAGSSLVASKTVVYEDFPDDDSVENFLKKLDEKYK